MRPRVLSQLGLLVLLVAVFAMIQVSSASAMNRIARAPVATVHTSTPTIQAHFYAYARGFWITYWTYPTNISMTLDGQPLAFTRVPTDPLARDVTATAQLTTPIAEGIHTIVASSDAGSETWTFDYIADPSVHPGITNVQPSGSRTSSWNGPVVFSVDSGLLEGSTTVATITVDGVPYPAAQQFSTLGNYVNTWMTEWNGSFFAGPASWTGGTHRIKVDARDGLGRTASREWSFDKNDAPVVGAVSPADLSFGNSATSTVISAAVSDQIGGIKNTSIGLKVNGSTVVHTYQSISTTQGVVTYSLPPSSADATVSVELKVPDHNGELTTKTWSFAVTAFPAADVHGTAPNGTCRECHGQDFNTIHLDLLPFEDLGHVYYPMNPKVLADQYCNCINCHQKLDTVVNDPGPMVQYKWDKNFPGTLDDYTRGQFCEICHINNGMTMFNEQWKYRQHGKSNQFTLTGLSPIARVKTPRETMDCTYCHQKDASQPYAFGPHDTERDHSIALEPRCAGTCHASTLPSEHVKPGRVDNAGGSIGCDTCHVNGSAAVKAVSGKKWLGGTDRWEVQASGIMQQTSSKVYYFGPWSYQRGGATVPVTKVKVQLKGSGGSVLQAFYNNTWNTVLSVPNWTASNVGTVIDPDKIYVLTLPGATAFKWEITCQVNMDMDDGIRAGLTVMDTSPARTKPTCASCHGVIEHRESHDQVLDPTCASCHPSNLVDAHGSTKCQTCHSSALPKVVSAIAQHKKTCDACHDLDAYHAHLAPAVDLSPAVPSSAVEFSTECASCHMSDMRTLHKKSADTSYGQHCARCHTSTETKIVAAIATRNTDCRGCHLIADVKHQDDHPASLDASCSAAPCHAARLSTDHEGRVSGCSTCHTQSRSRQEVVFSRSSCGDCHVAGHGQSLTASSTPDLMLDPRFTWTSPLSAATFAGETWMPAEAVSADGNVVLGDRTEVSPSSAWSTFRTAMVDRGWTAPSTTPASNETTFQATLSQGTRRCRLVLYDGETHRSTEDSQRGTRAEIVWWAE